MMDVFRRAGRLCACLGFLFFGASCERVSEATSSDASHEAGGAGRVAAVPAAPPQVELVWPTPNPAYLEGRELAEFVQPTVSGEVQSGLFGSVRSGGRQFHEGLDLFPLVRDKHGEPADEVGAAMAGVVKHVNGKAGASSYGRYVVLEHPEQSPPVYTLYAHLAEVASGIAPGVRVKAGARLGTMGRSAGGYTIPKERAHLHFEIGLRLTDSFQAWYKRRGFGSPNAHGPYNGMNLMGLDPLEFFARHRAGGLVSLDEVFREAPAAVTARVAHAGEPDFLRRYPSLLGSAPAPVVGFGGGWEIDFGATGVPLRWRRLPASELTGWKTDEVRIVAVDETLLAANRGRDLVKTSRGRPVPDEDLRTVLELLFGLRL